jgi:hypothetical protein
MPEFNTALERYGKASCDAFTAKREVYELKEKLRGKKEVSLTDVYELAFLRKRLGELKITEQESLADYINTATGIDLAALKI